MKLKHIKLGFLLVCLTFFTSAFAAQSPLPMLQSTGDKIIQELKKNQASLKNNPKISYNIIVKYMLPLVDQETMAQSVLGRNAWKSATNAQRQQFISAFRTLVVRTYASAISQFSNESIVFKPIRAAAQDQVTVNSQIIHTNGRPPIDISYRLQANGSSWKIIDFSVEGISMVQSFRSQFSAQLTQKGMAGLILALESHNKQSS